MRILFITLVIVCSCGIALSQSAQPTPTPRPSPEASVDSDNVNWDPIITSADIAKFPTQVTKPRLSLQRALKIAESYMKRQRIRLSSYFLMEAKMIQWGREQTPKEARWFFHWVSSNGPPVEITVSMKGKPSRAPSM